MTSHERERERERLCPTRSRRLNNNQMVWVCSTIWITEEPTGTLIVYGKLRQSDVKVFRRKVGR